MDCNEYFEKKKALLRDCVSLSEEMLSSGGDIEQVNSILCTRHDKITCLQELDGNWDQSGSGFLTEKQKLQINQMVTLLNDLDRGIAKQIKAEQDEIRNNMKINTQNHRLAGYTGKYGTATGRLINYKK